LSTKPFQFRDFALQGDRTRRLGRSEGGIATLRDLASPAQQETFGQAMLPTHLDRTLGAAHHIRDRP